MPQHSDRPSSDSFEGWQALTRMPRGHPRSMRPKSLAHTRPKRVGRTITRRELLRRGGLVAAGTFAATSSGFARASGPAPARKDASVVVIGAGLAGLSCVYRLHRHGIAATLYEAQERIGGRCFSLRGFFDAGQTAEHGGQDIDSRHHHIRSLAKESRIPLVYKFEQLPLQAVWIRSGSTGPRATWRTCSPISMPSSDGCGPTTGASVGTLTTRPGPRWSSSIR